LDGAVDLPSADVLIQLAVECTGILGVEVVVLSRRREGHEFKLLSNLSLAGYVELESRKLDEGTAQNLLDRLGISSPTQELLQLSQNLLNLELIGKVKLEKPEFDFTEVVDEIDLWEEFVNVLTERESPTIGSNQGEQIVSAAANLAEAALNSEDGSFQLERPLLRPLRRLDSWGVITCEYGRRYRFTHEKLQDYFYAWDATEREAMPQDVMTEISQHRTTRVLEWMKRIYARHSPSLYAEFLKRALGTDD